MSTDPQAIREDIERTRSELSSDVDALTDKVSPSRAAHRQADRVRSAFTSAKDAVMGTASDQAHRVGDRVSGTGHSIGDRLSDTGHAIGEAPTAVRDSARGNPLAAGLVAFGIGLLVASALPSTRREQDLARSAKEQAAPLVDEVKEGARQLADDLKQPAQEAASHVTEQAKEAGQQIKQEATSAAQDVREDAQGVQQQVREG